MDVDNWEAPPDQPIARKDASRSFCSPVFIGVFGTLLLHALLLHSVEIAGRSFKVRTQVPSIDSSAPASESSSENLVLIRLSRSEISQSAAVQNIVSSRSALHAIKFDSKVPDVAPPLETESLVLDEESAASPVTAGTEGSERARLAGIYTGQIQARIDRVWRRPRTAVDGATDYRGASTADVSFQCEAQIVQDTAGYVQEILLPRCNGSPAWHLSLVTAIRQASPLPAPPDPKVFARSVTLRFVALPYTYGAAEDEYEIASRTLARVR